jgi:PTH2 family peptidyl-tRNA hydrolase
MAPKLKQVIVIRKDLKMRRGKEVAQGAHASMKVVLENLENPLVQEWLDEAFTKVCVSVDSEEELFSIYDEAKTSGIIAAIITDSGLTEFAGVPTVTCAAIGPDWSDKIDLVTGHLKLR